MLFCLNPAQNKFINAGDFRLALSVVKLLRLSNYLIILHLENIGDICNVKIIAPKAIARSVFVSKKLAFFPA
jgi:hypothetical protein